MNQNSLRKMVEGQSETPPSHPTPLALSSPMPERLGHSWQITGMGQLNPTNSLMTTIKWCGHIVVLDQHPELFAKDPQLDLGWGRDLGHNT